MRCIPVILHIPILAQQTKIKGILQENVPAFLEDSRDHLVGYLSEREREREVSKRVPDRNEKFTFKRLPYTLIFFNTMKEKEANTPEFLLKRTLCLQDSVQSEKLKKESKVHPCRGTEAL
jgi:hypothetical protein